MDLETLKKILENDNDRKLIIKNIDQYNKNNELFKFAKDINTGLFILASSSDKKSILECPNIKCKKSIISVIRNNLNGSKTCYFKHKNSTECENYMIKAKDKDESDEKIKESLERIHDKAIEIIYNNLLAKKPININKICDFNYWMCTTLKTKIINLEDGDTVKKEYSFTWENNNYRADIAILDNNKQLKYIIEVAHTHKTEEHKRPNNIFWCEVWAGCVLNEVKKRAHTMARVDFNPELEPEIISYNCLKTVYCKGCMEENIRLKKNNDDVAIEKLRIVKENMENKIKKDNAEKERMIKTNEIKQQIMDRNLNCASCNKQIDKPGFKWLHINFENDCFSKYIKSNIVVCKYCFDWKYIGDSFKSKHPELYLKEYNRIKKISNLLNE